MSLVLGASLSGCNVILGIHDLPGQQDDGGVDAAPGSVDANDSDGSAPPTCVTPPSDIIAWWDGDSLGGDIVGSFSNPMEIGNPTLAMGIVGEAIQFGAGDLLSYDPAPMSTSGDFTLEGWVFLDHTHTNYYSIYGRYFETAVCTYNTRLVLWDSDLGGAGVGNLVTSDTELNQRWSHIAVTWDGSQSYLYINGVVEDSAQTGQPITLPSRAQVGGLINPNNGDLVDRFEGIIDELTLYERALGANEIQAIYNASTAGKCKP